MTSLRGTPYKGIGPSLPTISNNSTLAHAVCGVPFVRRRAAPRAGRAYDVCTHVQLSHYRRPWSARHAETRANPGVWGSRGPEEKRRATWKWVCAIPGFGPLAAAAGWGGGGGDDDEAWHCGTVDRDKKGMLIAMEPRPPVHVDGRGDREITEITHPGTSERTATLVRRLAAGRSPLGGGSVAGPPRLKGLGRRFAHTIPSHPIPYPARPCGRSPPFCPTPTPRRSCVASPAPLDRSALDRPLRLLTDTHTRPTRLSDDGIR